MPMSNPLLPQATLVDWLHEHSESTIDEVRAELRLTASMLIHADNEIGEEQLEYQEYGDPPQHIGALMDGLENRLNSEEEEE